MASLHGKKLNRKELLRRVGNMMQLAYIKSYRFDDGKSDGLRAYDVRNGSGLDYTVLGSKCLDIGSMSYRGVNLNFVAKPGFVSPEYFHPAGVSEFLRCFQGGLLYTCGLSNVGGPCSENGEDFCQHGRIGHIPAEKISVSTYWKDDDYLLEISGEIRQAALYGENLVLRRRIVTRLGENAADIHDEIENQGFEEKPLMQLYHFNIGYPMLDEGSRLIAPITETVSRDEYSEKTAGDFSNFIAPVDGYGENVYYHTLASDSSGRSAAALINDRLGLGVYIRFDTRVLPILTQWKSMHPGDYALGIEPSNCRVGGRVSERERGALRTIAPFETVKCDIRVGVLDGKREISEFENSLKAIMPEKGLNTEMYF